MGTGKRHSPEQILRKLMAADWLLAEGKDTVVPPESWRFPLCGFPVGGRSVLVVDGADHAEGAVSAVVVVEPVAPVKHNSLRLSG